MPTNTPVALPASDDGAMAACSSASQRHLEQQALLRIDAGRLARRDAEELRRRSASTSLHERSPTACTLLPAASGSGSKKRVDVPALGGHFGDRVDAVAQQLPERRRRVGAAGKAAADADDRDRLAAPRSRRAASLRLELLDRDQRALQQRRRSRVGGSLTRRPRAVDAVEAAFEQLRREFVGRRGRAPTSTATSAVLGVELPPPLRTRRRSVRRRTRRRPDGRPAR